jgi:hypothetical protein
MNEVGELKRYSLYATLNTHMMKLDENGDYVKYVDALSALVTKPTPQWPTRDHRLDVQCAKCGNEITAYLPCPKPPRVTEAEVEAFRESLSEQVGPNVARAMLETRNQARLDNEVSELVARLRNRCAFERSNGADYERETCLYCRAADALSRQQRPQVTEGVELLRILAPIITAYQIEDYDDFEQWLDDEEGFGFTDCHNCEGDIGTPRKWLEHRCEATLTASPAVPLSNTTAANAEERQW